MNSHLDTGRHHRPLLKDADCCSTLPRKSYVLHKVLSPRLQSSPAPVAVHKLLFAEGDELVSHDGVDTLNSASGGKGPAGAALQARRHRSVDGQVGQQQAAHSRACP